MKLELLTVWPLDFKTECTRWDGTTQGSGSLGPIFRDQKTPVGSGLSIPNMYISQNHGMWDCPQDTKIEIAHVIFTNSPDFGGLSKISYYFKWLVELFHNFILKCELTSGVVCLLRTLNSFLTCAWTSVSWENIIRAMPLGCQKCHITIAHATGNLRIHLSHLLCCYRRKAETCEVIFAHIPLPRFSQHCFSIVCFMDCGSGMILFGVQVQNKIKFGKEAT